MKFIHFEEIPSTQTCVKFKEFFYDKEKQEYIPTIGNAYYRINIDAVESFILNQGSDLVTVSGMVGKFFL